MRFWVIAASIAFMVCVVSGPAAARYDRKERPIGSGWHLAELAFDGEPAGCEVNKFVMPRTLFTVARLVSGAWAISLNRIGGLRSDGRATARDPISLLVQGQTVYSGHLKSRSKDAGDLEPLLTYAMILRIAGSDTLQLIWDGRAVEYDIRGFRAAALRVIECEMRVAPPATTKRESTPSPPRNDARGSSGTGFFVTATGTVLTNEHVVHGCSALTVDRQKTSVSAVLVAADKSLDLAILTTSLLPPRVLAFRNEVRVGEGVATYGFPLPDHLASSGNFTQGYVTALAGPRDHPRFLQMTTPVQPGNSGGPLLDMSANIVGVVTGKLDAIAIAHRHGDIPQNTNFSIKASIAYEFLAKHGVHPSLGSLSSTAMAPPDLAEVAQDASVMVRCARVVKEEVREEAKSPPQVSEDQSKDRPPVPARQRSRPITVSQCTELVMKKYVYIYAKTEREIKIGQCMATSGTNY
ncbi:MAG: S1C family serine protease [Hyphomicrobiaceae bacterium]